MNERMSIGLDLGTSNSVSAIAAPEDADVTVVPVTQVFSPNTIGESEILPSALYLPNNDEFPAGSLKLPWSPPETEEQVVVGAYAREHGALVPERLITSAKSWLCNPHIDRRAPVLPWSEEAPPNKCSPVQASALVLAHMRDNLLSVRTPGFRLEESLVVLTVPASFDEVARSLTREAAHAAGWEEVLLLEEPQAAFYSWIAASDGHWREQVGAGDIVLVCDIGGGTADFSMIAVSEKDGRLELNRISVGDHILLGGDNMDLALAYAAQGKLEAEGHSLSSWQFLSLVQSARQAKERLFSAAPLDEMPVSIPNRGSSLFQQLITTKISREQAQAVILGGFFPLVDVNEHPEQRRSAGLQEFGLPYASDPALTKHLALFLRNSIENVRSDEKLRQLVGESRVSESRQFLRPSAVLFNGGVCKAPVIRERVLDLLQRWNDGQEVRELQGAELDLAVARGAAYYGRTVASGEGLRIRAGTPRSYYLGLETSMPAVPGYRPPVKGLCLVPQGTEEGTTLPATEREFGLVTGEQVEFRFFSSTKRAGDAPGTVIENAERDLEETSRLEAFLPGEEGRAGEVVPVRLQPAVNELGVLELWMQHTRSDRRWKLDFNLRAK